MCGRYELNVTKDELIETFDIDQWELDKLRSRFNIPPTAKIPMIKANADGRIIQLAHWGLIPSWSKEFKMSYSTFNARSETVADKASFRSAYKHRRCLIPASSYYEWRKLDDSNKQPYRISRDNNKPFAMAGLYEDWTDKDSGEVFQSCTVVTREAYPELTEIHHRMPVILPEDSFDNWLSFEEDDFPTMDMQQLDYYPIDPAVGTVSNNYLFKAIN